jgi:SAM-dependent methyltransferase
MVVPVDEQLIRPRKLFDEYLALAAIDAEQFFGRAERRRIPCPACGAADTAPAFEKLGFAYEDCPHCQTLFVNPRPVAEAFDEYARHSKSVQFWATDFYRQTEEHRRQRLIRPKAEKAARIIAELRPGWAPACLVDVGAGYGVFVEEVRACLDSSIPVIALEPVRALADVCRAKGLVVVEKMLQELDPLDLPDGSRVLTSFELLEHLHDPEAFLGEIATLLKGGLFIMTTLSGTGFDLRILRARSKSIHPPHHINFFNPGSVATLFARVGLRVLLLETPGALDVDIASQQLEAVSDPFLRSVLTAPPEVRGAFQEFLQKALLSSHMLVVATSG